MKCELCGHQSYNKTLCKLCYDGKKEFEGDEKFRNKWNNVFDFMMRYDELDIKRGSKLETSVNELSATEWDSLPPKIQTRLRKSMLGGFEN